MQTRSFLTSRLLFIIPLLFTLTVSARFQTTKRRSISHQTPIPNDAPIIHSDFTPQSSLPITQDPTHRCPGHLISINSACHTLADLPSQFAIHYATHTAATKANLGALAAILRDALQNNKLSPVDTERLEKLLGATTISGLSGKIEDSGKDVEVLKGFYGVWAGVEGGLRGLSEGQFREVERGVGELVGLQRVASGKAKEFSREIERVGRLVGRA
ncbi:hypothetical protein BJ875DRAFT_440646 [Amylocarpus encephaloides]|uniref:Uncharacterized protein n=1 Tax=Amylocarpus encephaloides TaxID=45428 RepID=A0A9P7YKD7_9HELO|nr:hypothetical protein BJ875DRAFT_440646 [Amylocarpus encephaloides]